MGQILGTLCRRKGIEIIEAECMPDHVHMLVRIPPKYSVSEVVGYLKGKKFANDIREACESEVQVQKPSVLVPGILWAWIQWERTQLQ